MTSAYMPALLARGIAVAIFSLAILMIGIHTVLMARAADRSTLPPRTRTLIPFLASAFLSVWLGLAIATGDGANFPQGSNELRLPFSLAVGFGPMIVATVLLFWSRSMRLLNDATPAAWLVRVQSYRMAGVMFLYPFLYFGVVPAGFAVPAAVGDVLIGAFAPLVAAAVERGRPESLRWAVAWNALGILDLIIAPAAAILSHAQAIFIYPLALVPLFAGPPLGILTHIYSLRNLSVTMRRAAVRASLGGSARPHPSRDLGAAMRIR